MANKLIDEVKKNLREQLGLAQCGLTGIRVAACLVASKKDFSHSKHFYGANIELSTGTCYHAEEVALIKAINEGHIILERVYVASNSEAQRAALCLSCRDKFYRVDKKCKVIVLDEKFNATLITSIEQSVNFAYQGRILVK